jgi:ribonuclease P protein component
VALPKVHRLRRRQDFSAVYQAGLRRSTANLTLRALRPPKSGAKSEGDLPIQPVLPTRIGISISQKVSKRAVVRNQIKRRLKAILRQLLPNIAPGWQIVIVVKPGSVQCGYEQFLQELKQLLIQSEVIDGH